ncbi:MAG: hypothetical protein AB8B63_01815 [Granulosicoccus sp.]
MDLLTEAAAKDLAEKYGSPFYLIDVDKFSDNLDKITSSFSTIYPNVRFGYSYKTNYVPSICKEAMRKHFYAEVVSELEYALALRLGNDPENIIFNGPVKKKALLIEAVAAGSLTNIDNIQEIEFLETGVRKGIIDPALAKIGVRISIKIAKADGSSALQNGLDVGRFGFEQTEAVDAIKRIRKIGIEPIALHGHASSSDRSAANFGIITSTLCQVRRENHLDKLEYINVGGGLFGDVPRSMIKNGVPSFEDYATSINSILAADPWVLTNKPTLIVEPGVSVVADCVDFYTTICNIKKVSDKRFAVVDGSVYNIRPTMHSLKLPYVHVNAREGSETFYKYDIVGSTCMEKDVMAQDADLSDLKVGDFVAFSNVGAYTLVMTPPFINLSPAIVLRSEGESLKQIRAAQTVDSFFNDYRDLDSTLGEQNAWVTSDLTQNYITKQPC